MACRIVPRSKLLNRQLNELIRYFALEVSASRSAREIGIHRHTADRLYTVIRKRIVIACEKETPLGPRANMKLTSPISAAIVKAVGEERLERWLYSAF